MLHIYVVHALIAYSHTCKLLHGAFEGTTSPCHLPACITHTTIAMPQPIVLSGGWRRSAAYYDGK